MLILSHESTRPIQILQGIAWSYQVGGNVLRQISAKLSRSWNYPAWEGDRCLLWNRALLGRAVRWVIRKRRSGYGSKWQWNLDEVFIKIVGDNFRLWRAVGHEEEVLETYVTKRRDKRAALKFLRKTIWKHGSPKKIITDKLRSYGAALKKIGAVTLQDAT